MGCVLNTSGRIMRKAEFCIQHMGPAQTGGAAGSKRSGFFLSLEGGVHRGPRPCHHPRCLLKHVRQLQQLRLPKGAANHLQGVTAGKAMAR